MINLKDMIAHTSKYLDRIMIEIEPADLIQICERAIAAEELAEARLLLLHRAAHNLSNADTEIRELKAQLVELEKQEPAGVTSNMFGPMGFTTATFDSSKVPVNTNVYVKPVQLSAEKPVGYLVRGTFFYSKDQAQNSCDYITENFENCIVEPVYLSAEQPKLTVWYGPMPESNGKSNWTALLHRADEPLGYDGHTIDRSEYPERVRYEADRVRYLIGELEEMPDILAYDADKHSGYVEPIPEVVGQQTLSDTTLELLNKTTVQIQVMPNGYPHISRYAKVSLPQGFYDCVVLTDKLKQIIQDTVEHGTGFAVTDTDGIQHVKQKDVLSSPPSAELETFKMNDMPQLKQSDSAAVEPTGIQVYRWFQESTIAHHIEEDGRHISKRSMFIAKKAFEYALSQAKLQRITEQDAREIALAFVKVRNKYTSAQSSDLFSGWINTGEGSTLLAKLNEHREPNLQTHNLNHLELIKAKQYSFMNCALCSHSVNVAVLVRSTNCSVHICESCAHAIDSEFKQPTQR